LRRAKKRNKKLPEILEKALLSNAELTDEMRKQYYVKTKLGRGSYSNTPGSEAGQKTAGDAGESVAFGGSGMSSYKKTELATTLRVEQAKQTDVDLLVEREREREREREQ
jgi:hypothetical protein